MLIVIEQNIEQVVRVLCISLKQGLRTQKSPLSLYWIWGNGARIEL